jgi:hypothetical protein
MGIIHQKDKRTGVTYVYESKAFWDKEKKQARAKRKLIGKLDPVTGEVIPTDGRCKKRSPYYDEKNDNAAEMPKTVKELKEEILRLREENSLLKEKISFLENL